MYIYKILDVYIRPHQSINHFNGKKTSYIKSFWPIPTVDIVKSFYEKKLIVILHYSGL